MVDHIALQIKRCKTSQRLNLQTIAIDADKIEIVGGAMGTQVLDANGIKALAALPSLDQLRGTLIGLIQAPATKIAQLVTAPAAKLARVFGAYAKEAA